MMDSPVNTITLEAAAWSANRELYPGWLVAPDRARERVWDLTQAWLPLIVRSLGDLPLGQQLVMLYELNWRLEVALLPLWTDVTGPLTTCLESINPFPEQLDLPGSLLKPSANNLNRQRPGWSEIRPCWLALAFALLRFHREERQRQDFTRWAERLQKVTARLPDLSARLCYEHCLYGLGEMDDEAVRRSLAEWPAATGDLAWQIRKAAVLGEIGELYEATVLAEATLAQLRTGLRHTTEEIPSLSREGWAMLLLNALHNAKWLARSGTCPDYRGRWQQLASYGCDPWPELELLETKLDQPVPLPKSTVSKSAAFQPRTYTRSYSVGNSFGRRLVPAYQYMRLVEEAPYPPRCGKVGLSVKSLRKIGEWLIHHDPVRTQALICRLMDRKLADRYFSRHRIAALPAEAVEDFHRIAVRAVRQAHSRTHEAGDPGDEAILERVNSRLYVGIEILGRVALRLAPEHLPGLWQLAVELYGSLAVRRSVDLTDPLKTLFRSLMLAMQRKDLEQRFLELVALPIPGAVAFPVAVPEFWPEFVVELRERLPEMPRKTRAEDWSAVTRGLLKAAGDENAGVRGRAILRLSVLYGYGYLKQSEVKRLAKVYWLKVSEQTRLPEVNGLRNWECLTLPEPEAGVSTERFRRYALAVKLPPIQGGVVDPNSLLLDWLRATNIPARTAGHSEEQRFVEWTPEEAAAMLQMIVEWWEGSGRVQAAQIRSSSPRDFFADPPFQSRVEHILDVLRWVVIPRITSPSPVADQVLGFVGDIERSGVPVGTVLPALLLLRPDDETAVRLRHDLASAETDRYLSALRGLIYWLENQLSPQRPEGAPQLPPLPLGLLQELGTIIAWRRQPGLLHALDAVMTILLHFPETVDEQFRRSLGIGLEYLLTETTYRVVEGEGGSIPYDEVPNYRARAAQVAASLHAGFGETLPVIERWLEAARADPLPEVREAVMPKG